MSVKLRFKVFIFVFYLSVWHVAYAAPAYGTKMPKKGRVFAGLESYTVFKRELENDMGKMRSLQYFILASYGVFDWLSIDLKGGSGDIRQHPQDHSEIDYSLNFAGGYGLRARLYEKENTKIVFGFQHISVHPKSAHVDQDRHKAILDDWQVSLLVSHAFGRLTPYIGTRWSRMDYIHRINANRKRLMSDLTKSQGLVLGTDFSLDENTWCNLEASYFDSTALAFSINFAL